MKTFYAVMLDLNFVKIVKGDSYEDVVSRYTTFLESNDNNVIMDESDYFAWRNSQ